MWAGRGLFGVIVAGLVGYLAVVGLDRADKLGSVIGSVVAVIALIAPYLLPAPTDVPDRVEDSGKARATGGGQANTGVQVAGDDRPARVTGSGDAVADGPGSVANTGVQRHPRP
ncbi:hypothetical protein GCM10010168_71940 [Actinoplanes ianthinogenes]|uniref:Uncharacterized protein n=1 Tax=Actinoplanes ianthinogenes TaxID=122358 RepID=A0ABM7M6E0_9ACTN|nr:hypothetical protein Aiant_78740 [Actinoplanes ianthinogenes]GGR42635.1 hypothetical protein GCM10010168_71940 [Actinoplanes ianthinogenes]